MDGNQNYHGNRLAGPLMEQIGEHLSGGIVGCRWETGFPFFYINERFLAFTGYTYEEFQSLTGGRVLAAVHPDDQARVSAIINAELAQSGSYQVEYRIRRKDGGYAWLRGMGKQFTGNAGEKTILSVSIDITESVELRRQLETKTRELSDLIDSIPCGIAKVGLDEELSIEFANEFYYNILGYSRAEAKEARLRTVRFFTYPADWAPLAEKIKGHMARGSRRFELEHRCINRRGEIRWVLARCNFDGKDHGALTCVMLDITDRRQMEEQLRISEEENRIALRHTNNTIDIYEVSTRTLTQPQAAAELFGVPAVMTNMPDSALKSGIVEEGNREGYVHFFEQMNRGVPEGNAVLQLRDAEGSTHWFDGQYTMIFGEDGTPQRAILSYEDITERRKKEIAYQKWSQAFETHLEDTLGYYEYNLTKDLYDRSESTMFEKLPVEIASFTEMVNYVADYLIYEEDAETYRKIFDRKQLLLHYYSGKKELCLEHRRKRGNGEIYWAEGSIQLLPDPYSDDVKAFVLIKNIDAEKTHALRLKMLSEQDALTGLLNRRAVVERINQTLETSAPGTSHALIMLDIDCFKQLNDTYGHRFGDQVIQELGEKMQRQLRAGDCCGRLGGDEFVVFMCGVKGAEELEPRLASLSEALTIRYSDLCGISVSMGLSVFPRDGGDFDSLYQKADVALYEAKRGGRAGYVIYRGESSC